MKRQLAIRSIGLAIALLLLPSCSDGDGRPAPKPIYSEAGSSWIAGLKVPVGTRLVGLPFPQPGDASISALQVEGDPLAAWDDLADQAHALGIPMQGGAVCRWALPDSPHQPIVQVTERPSLPPTLLHCFGSSSSASIGLTATMWWGAFGSHPASLLSVTVGAPFEPSPIYPGADPGPAPIEAHDYLGPMEPSPVPNEDKKLDFTPCSETDDPFRMPDGALYLGASGEGMVLATNDAEAVIRAFANAVDSRDSDEGDYKIERRGDEWAFKGYLPGGGSCGAVSYANGTLIWLTASELH